MFINHRFVTKELSALGNGLLYEYLVGSNGVFVRAARAGLRATVWVASTARMIRGLQEIAPNVEIDTRVPASLTQRMLDLAKENAGKEILFYLAYRDGAWALQIPEQIQSAGNVRPLDPFVGGTDTLIEVHSHHNMGAFFSLTDNQEEQAGFRVYAVLGRVEHNPAINCRVGIYGHFCEIPAEWVFELPAGMVDASYPIDIEENEESEYVD